MGVKNRNLSDFALKGYGFCLTILKNGGAIIVQNFYANFYNSGTNGTSESL